MSNKLLQAIKDGARKGGVSLNTAQTREIEAVLAEVETPLLPLMETSGFQGKIKEIVQEIAETEKDATKLIEAVNKKLPTLSEFDGVASILTKGKNAAEITAAKKQLKPLEHYADSVSQYHSAKETLSAQEEALKLLSSARTGEDIDKAYETLADRIEKLTEKIDAKRAIHEEMGTSANVSKLENELKSLNRVESALQEIGGRLEGRAYGAEEGKVAEALKEGRDILSEIVTDGKKDLADTAKSLRKEAGEISKYSGDFSKTMRDLGVNGFNLSSVIENKSIKLSDISKGEEAAKGGRKFSALLFKGEEALKNAGVTKEGRAVRSWAEASEVGKLGKAFSAPKVALGAVVVGTALAAMKGGKKDNFDPVSAGQGR